MDDLGVDMNRFQSNLSQFRHLEQKFISCSFRSYPELRGIRNFKMQLFIITLPYLNKQIQFSVKQALIWSGQMFQISDPAEDDIFKVRIHRVNILLQLSRAQIHHVLLMSAMRAGREHNTCCMLYNIDTRGSRSLTRYNITITGYQITITT